MKTKKKGKGNKGLTALIIALLVVVGLFLTLVNLIIEFQWFNELGYASVFLTRIFTQIAIAVPLFIVTGLIVFVYLKVLKKGYYRKIESHINDKSVEKKLNIAAAGLAAIAGGILAYYVASLTWFEVLRFMHRTPFDLVDPQFGLDISFYVFQLDLIRQVNNILIGVIVGFAALTAVYYALLMSFRRPQVFEDVYDDDDEEFGGHQRGRQQSKGNMEDFITQILQMLGVPAGGQNQQQNRGAQPQPKKKLDDENLTNILKIASNQVRVLGVLFFIMVGVHFFLRQFDILFSSTGAVFGAGFTDVTVTLWMHRLLAVLSLAAAVGFVLGLNKKKLRTILTVPAIMVLVGGLGAASAFVVQQYVVSPDELNRERAFLYRNITYTRIAYGLDNVDVRYFPVQNTLTRADIDNNRETIANIRINDHEPVRRFYSNMQAIRPYYVFPAVFVDRYIIDGELT
ncbi:MAG: UPF0182 family protein, partial [Clostridiales bacterium]|nr:UPF0182 family protein [Clostridiales bacterium]